MKINDLQVYIFKKISFLYNFIFGRKTTQKLNNIIFSLSLRAKGYNNYGSFKVTGEKNFIQSISRELQFSLDIGANIGNYSKLLIEETNSYIFAFEPLDGAYDILNNLVIEHPNRIEAFKLALGDKNVEKNLNFTDEKSEKATFLDDINKLSFYEAASNKKKLVNLVTLDEFMEQKNLFDKEIDLIKIDTEGYELEVLKGSKRLIEENKPKYIQLEFNIHQLFKNHTMYEFSKYLKKYELFQILPFGNKLLKVNPEKAETNIFYLTNFVYIRNDLVHKF
tara:strand:+ start:304 stop:1140 length:837 start_codon:yes stop_codon:yes gene_type:complete